ncbi:general substrate transporter [Amylostereum chailletii]|nr:general substrate transporter [Amylostereum chailletii]
MASDLKNEKDSIQSDAKVDVAHEEHPTFLKGEKVVEALNADFAAAVETGRINPFTKTAFVVYCCAAVAFMCSCGNGYDGSVMTGINGMTTYNKFNQGQLDVSTGIIFSIYTIGQMCGSLVAGFICDRFGRRAAMFTGCLFIMAGSAVIASSEAKNQFIGGRFVLGFGIAIATIGAPTFTVECSPPQWRGRLTGLYNTGWNGGAIPAAGITLATSNMTSDWGWRIPLIIQAVPASIVVCTVWFLPESPRWTMAQGRKEEAFAWLTKYHGNGDPKHPVVQLEMREFQENIHSNGSDKRWWDFKSLLVNRNHRWRFLMVFLMGFFGQMSGNGLGYFNVKDIPVFSLGFGKKMQFNMNLINTCLNAIAAWIATAFADKIPRRKVLIVGTALCSVCLALNAGFSAVWAKYPDDGPKNLKIGNAAVTFYYFFNIVYSFTYTPLQSLYPAECLENATRAKGISMKIFVIGCTSFINLFCTPPAYAVLGWKYILVFVFWDAFETVIWYFFCVETQGRTLEELDEIFSAPNPSKASRQKRTARCSSTFSLHSIINTDL